MNAQAKASTNLQLKHDIQTNKDPHEFTLNSKPKAQPAPHRKPKAIPAQAYQSQQQSTPG